MQKLKQQTLEILCPWNFYTRRQSERVLSFYLCLLFCVFSYCFDKKKILGSTPEKNTFCWIIPEVAFSPPFTMCGPKGVSIGYFIFSQLFFLINGIKYSQKNKSVCSTFYSNETRTLTKKAFLKGTYTKMEYVIFATIIALVWALLLQLPHRNFLADFMLKNEDVCLKDNQNWKKKKKITKAKQGL